MPKAQKPDTSSPALYLGISENAPRERLFLERGGVSIQTIIPEYEKMLDNCDLSTDEGVLRWAARFGRRRSDIEKLLLDLRPDSVDSRWTSARERWLHARLLSAFAGSAVGKPRFSRLVLSGHHSKEENKLFGHVGQAVVEFLEYDTLATITGWFPEAANGVRDLMISACRSLGGTEALRLRLLFPNLQTAWGYAGRSPATTEGGKVQTAAAHIAKWARLTADGLSRIRPAAIKGLRNVKVLTGAEIGKVQKYAADDLP
jgi:hypothetical protein